MLCLVDTGTIQHSVEPECNVMRDQLWTRVKPIQDGLGANWDDGGDPTQTENKEELKVLETNMSSKPHGTLRMALILACYSLGHKRLPTSYYSNNSPSEVPELE